VTARTRPATEADEPFLRAVFAHSRDADFAGLAADAALLATILDQQYRAQRAAHGAHHPAARREVIVEGDAPVGSIEVDRDGAGWTVLDFAVLREHRGRGIGTQVLSQLLGRAAEAAAAVDLQVLPWNPAARLYERLGFVVVGGDETRLRLRRDPASVTPA